jgi:hypothetical protein
MRLSRKLIIQSLMMKGGLWQRRKNPSVASSRMIKRVLIWASILWRMTPDQRSRMTRNRKRKKVVSQI